jgi:predicted alpha/beta superfamily hydrolase
VRKSLIVCLVLPLLIVYFGCSGSNNPTNPNPDPDPEPFPTNIPGYFYSENVVDTYLTDLSLPAGYDPNNSQGFHTIYILDSDRWFNVADSVINDLVNATTIPPVILIGIRSPSAATRGRDFYHPRLRSMPPPDNGHADNFYNFLKLELIPFADSAFNTQGQNGRTLIGWSASGYFTLWNLFHYNPPSEPLMFKNYLSISPGSIWWSDYNILDLIESTASASSNNIPANLYTTLEEFVIDTSIADWHWIDSVFESKSYNNFNYQGQYFPGTEHFTTIPAPSISHGLTWFFGL